MKVKLKKQLYEATLEKEIMKSSLETELLISMIILYSGILIMKVNIDSGYLVYAIPPTVLFQFF